MTKHGQRLTSDAPDRSRERLARAALSRLMEPQDAGGLALVRLAGSYVQDVRIPGLVPIVGSAIVLLVAAVVASLLPAARAARVDVMDALRAE